MTQECVNEQISSNYASLLKRETVEKTIKLAKWIQM